MRKLIVVNEAFRTEDFDRVRKAVSPHGFDVQCFSRDTDALSSLEDAEIIFGASALLARNAPRLDWLCTPSAGIDQFLAPGTFASPQARLTNSSGAYGVTISEHVVMITLEMLRRQQDYNALVSRREWVRNLPVRSILGSRIALLGTGDIGQEIARRLRGFLPARLTGFNRSGRNPGGLFDEVLPLSSLDKLLPETDILIASLPGTSETFHILDHDRLCLLPEKALVVNVGRGSLIDESALLPLLLKGHFLAALDVFETEPLPADSPLWSCPGLLTMPHVAGNMTLPYTRERIISLFLEDFDNFRLGRPLLREVDLKRGY